MSEFSTKVSKNSSWRNLSCVQQKFCSWLRLVLCFPLLRAMAENQWSCKVILNLIVKTKPSTWMSFFILLKRKVAKLHFAEFEVITWQFNQLFPFLCQEAIWQCVFFIENVSLIQFSFVIPSRKHSFQWGDHIWALFFSVSTKDKFSFCFQWVNFLKVMEWLAVLFCCFCMFCWCCFLVAFVLSWTFKGRLFSSMYWHPFLSLWCGNNSVK